MGQPHYPGDKVSWKDAKHACATKFDKSIEILRISSIRHQSYTFIYAFTLIVEETGDL